MFLSRETWLIQMTLNTFTIWPQILILNLISSHSYKDTSCCNNIPELNLYYTLICTTPVSCFHYLCFLPNYISYLLLYNKLPPNLMACNNTYCFVLFWIRKWVLCSRAVPELKSKCWPGLFPSQGSTREESILSSLLWLLAEFSSLFPVGQSLPLALSHVELYLCIIVSVHAQEFQAALPDTLPCDFQFALLNKLNNLIPCNKFLSIYFLLVLFLWLNSD